jgi:signal peptidase
MKAASNTLYYLAIGVVGLIGLLFALTLVPIPGNYEIKVVKSGSMEPAIHVGSIVVIKPASSYAVGDVITFGEDTKTQIPTTHRIVKIEGTGSQMAFTTKGDANDTEDQTSTSVARVKGKMLFTVPYAGYVLAFARTKLGFFLLVGIPALVVFFEEGRSIYKEFRRMRARRKKVVEKTDEDTEAPQPRATRKVMGIFALFAVVSALATSGVWGSTISYYANSAISQGNTLRAGTFNIQAVGAVILSDVTAFLMPPGGDEPVVDPEATSTQEIVVEVTTSEVVIE